MDKQITCKTWPGPNNNNPGTGPFCAGSTVADDGFRDTDRLVQSALMPMNGDGKSAEPNVNLLQAVCAGKIKRIRKLPPDYCRDTEKVCP